MVASFHLFIEHSTWFTRLLRLYWLVGTSVGIKATLRTRVSIFTMGPRTKEVGPITDQHRLGSFPPLLVQLFSSGEGKVEEPFILGMNGHGGRPQPLSSIGFLRCSARTLSRSAFLLFPTLLLLVRLLLGNHRGFLLLRGRHGLRPPFRLQDTHRKGLREKEQGQQFQLAAYHTAQAARGKLAQGALASFAGDMSGW